MTEEKAFLSHDWKGSCFSNYHLSSCPGPLGAGLGRARRVLAYRHHAF